MNKRRRKEGQRLRKWDKRKEEEGNNEQKDWIKKGERKQ